MKVLESQVQKMVACVFKELKNRNLVQFKAPEEKVFQHAVNLIKKDFDNERELEQEVHKMMDDMERKNPGSFERYKMFPLLKRKLAEKKGIIL